LKVSLQSKTAADPAGEEPRNMNEASSESKSGALTWFWTVWVVFWFSTLGWRALIHPDEGRYAALSLGMLQSGDWVTPRLNGILYFEKPALQYWAGAISFLVFGVNEFAARFWPALTGILSVLAVGMTAHRVWGSGQRAALVMASSTWVIGNSHFLTLDMSVTFFLTLALCAFLWAQQDGATLTERRYGMYLAWAAMAGATLSKGLIGVLIPSATLVLYSLATGQWAIWRRMQWSAGLAIYLVLAVPWFWLVSQRNPGFAHFFFIHEHFDRFLTTVHRREGHLWYFVPILLLGFLPWTSLLPRLFREAWPRRHGQVFQAERFLLIWAVFVFSFFSKSSSKLPSYILPMFPALALLLGQVLRRLRPEELKRHLWLPALAWAVLASAYPFAGMFASEQSPLPAMQHFALFLAVGGAGFLICVLFAWRRLTRQASLPALMLVAAGSLWGVSAMTIGHDALGQYKSSKALVDQVRSQMCPDTALFSVRIYDQSLPFYLRRPVTQVEYRDEFDFGQRAEPGKAIATLGEFPRRWRNEPQAMAMLDKPTFAELQRLGTPMHVVFSDPRRMIVVKQPEQPCIKTQMAEHAAHRPAD
jgi:4-amino-4-deoxy-L-arabinose transferase-like glycosyltransferase